MKFNETPRVYVQQVTRFGWRVTLEAGFRSEDRYACTFKRAVRKGDRMLRDLERRRAFAATRKQVR